jgi:hypothetical protein
MRIFSLWAEANLMCMHLQLLWFDNGYIRLSTGSTSSAEVVVLVNHKVTLFGDPQTAMRAFNLAFISLGIGKIMSKGHSRLVTQDILWPRKGLAAYEARIHIRHRCPDL